MCGIFGYCGFHKVQIEENILPHRGPDDWGVDVSTVGEKYITLFQSRLSIIGLGDQGHQPFQKYRGNTLIFNGEIYNYKEINEILLTKYGVENRTATDTEVLYESIINMGIENTISLINGMFAFAYYDKNLQTITLVRDNLGVKPLYYSKDENDFIFSSEIKSFFNLGLRTATLNRAMLGEYFANGWVYEPNTLFKNIYKLNAGHLLTYDIQKNSIKDEKYWDVNTGENKVSVPELEKVIFSQTVADVPIGNYFSGGIDSSIITYTLRNKDILNINLSFEDGEASRVKMMANAYGLQIEKIKYDNSNLELNDRLVYYLDEPIADPAIIPAYQLAQISRKYGRYVMLSGMGGDEIDAGYSRHKIIGNRFLKIIIPLIPKVLIRVLLAGKQRRDYFRLREFAKNWQPENYFNLIGYFSRSEINKLIKSNDWFEEYRIRINEMCSDVSEKKKYYYLDLKGYLASHNLIYMDKASMAASVEVRVPLLDKDLVQYFFNNIGTKENVGKKRLKSYLAKLLGEKYRNIKKEGFRYDIDQWLTNDIDWNEVIKFFQEINLIDVGILKRYISTMGSSVTEVSMKLWTIYILYIWLKTFNVEIPNETVNSRP